MNNLTQTIQQLNKAPDAYLQQLVASKGPLSTFALVVQDQRQHLRNSLQPAAQGKPPSVAEQVSMRAQPEPVSGEAMQQGLGALPVQMSSGGIVAFAGGDDVPYTSDIPGFVPRNADTESDITKARPAPEGTSVGEDVMAWLARISKGIAEKNEARRNPKGEQAPVAVAQPAPKEVAATPATVPAPAPAVKRTTPPAEVGSPAENGIRVTAADAAEAKLGNYDMSDLPRSIVAIQGIAKTSPELGAALMSQLKERAKALSIPWPQERPAVERPAATASQSSPLANESAALLGKYLKQDVPPMDIKGAAAKVNGAQDLFGIPALIAQREAMAAKYQDSQDAAVARKRAVVEKQNGLGANVTNMLDAMNTAIGKRTVYKRADLPGAAIAADSAFRKESQAREAGQVKEEDTQRAMRYDMEQKLHEAKVLYAQGKTQAAEALVAKVLVEQQALDKDKARTAGDILGLGSAEKRNDASVAASMYGSDNSARSHLEGIRIATEGKEAAASAKGPPVAAMVSNLKALQAERKSVADGFEPNTAQMLQAKAQKLQAIDAKMSAVQKAINEATGIEMSPATGNSGWSAKILP